MSHNRNRLSSRSLRSILGVSAALVPLFLAGASLAQTAPEPETGAQTTTVDEIVVTARKRTERLQDVPVSAAVVGGEQISDQGIATIQDLTSVVPAVKLAKGSTTNRQFIRGIGSGDNPGFEQSVGTFIDDIYHGRARSSEAGLFDIGRVEILKGPQTTYFGNNAIAGALNIVTRDPGMSFGGNVRAAYTPTFDGRALEAGVDLPVSDMLRFRLSGLATESDGWISDLGTGEHVPETRTSGVRGTMIWEPSDTFTARIKAQYTDEDGRGGLALVRGGCPQPAGFPGPTGFCAAAIAQNAGPLSADFERNTGPNQSSSVTSQDYSASLSWDLPGMTLTSVTGYSAYDYDLRTDLDLTPANLLSITAPESYDQFSQELRLTSDEDGPVSWIAGLYYQKSGLDLTNVLNYAFLSPQIAAAPPFAALIPYLPFGIRVRVQDDAETWSGFGAVTWKATDRLTFTGALRYTQVSKDFEQIIDIGSQTPILGPFVPLPDSLAALGGAFSRAAGLATPGTIALDRQDDHLSPSVSVQFKATENISLYARYDNGFKAGGFNGVDLSGTASALPFSPEGVDAYEAGIKSRLFEGRATLNVDVFRSEYSDLQLAGIVPSAAGAYLNRVQNAGGAVTQGLEVETTIRVTPELTTSLALTLLDSHYTSYPNATPTAAQTLAGIRTQDLAGESTPFAPEYAGNWSLTYERPLSEGLSIRIANQLFFSGEQSLNFNNDPFVNQKAYVREDLTVAVAHDSGWEVAVVGKNLGDETIRTFGAAIPATLGAFVYATEPPRSVTVQFKYDF